MTYILLGIFLLTSTSCFGLEQQNICAKCKYFIQSQNFDAEFGKCLLFSKVDPFDKIEERRKLIEFLVTGVQKEPLKKDPEYHFCSIARSNEDMCGESGKKYNERLLNNNDNL
jgi:hypothetical protein